MLTFAADFLSIAIPRITGLGMSSSWPPMSKFWIERCVWHPQYLFAGTFKLPIESFSTRNYDGIRQGNRSIMNLFVGFDLEGSRSGFPDELA